MATTPLKFELPAEPAAAPAPVAPVTAAPVTADNQPAWFFAALSGTAVAVIALGLFGTLLWQQQNAHAIQLQERIGQLSSQVVALNTRLNDTITTANDNITEQRRTISELSNAFTTSSATLRQGIYTGAQEAVVQRESLRSLEQRLGLLQDSTSAQGATLSLLSSASRNLQRTLKSHDDQLRGASAAPSLAGNATPTVYIEGGNMPHPQAKAKAAPTAPSNTDILALPLPGSSELLFGR